MKKGIIKTACFLLALLFPVLPLSVTAVKCGTYYDESYYNGLHVQYERLNSVNEEKVVVVGGSNVAFGLDSALFEELYGKKVVDFGLYGSLGTKVMMDLSKTNLNRGDTVIIAPEFSDEAYTLYFGAESFLKATENHWDIRLRADFANYGDMLAATYNYISTKLSYTKNNEKVSPTGVYRADSLNEYGDIRSGLRLSNEMPLGYLQINAFNYDIDDDFIDYVNKYVSYCSLRGVTVYFSFSPVNQLALERCGFEEDAMEKLYYALSDRLNCEIISNPADYVYDFRYFYDTNFHLNDSGVVLRTVQLVRDLKLAREDTSKVQAVLPDAPAWTPPTADIDDTLVYTDSALFEYETDEMTGTLRLTGVKEEAQNLEEIVIPIMHDGVRITIVGSRAFSQCKQLRKITVPVGIFELYNLAFDGCTSLLDIYVLAETEEELSVSPATFSGLSEDYRIVLVNAERTAFGNDYDWSTVGGHLVKEED